LPETISRYAIIIGSGTGNAAPISHTTNRYSVNAAERMKYEKARICAIRSGRMLKLAMPSVASL
jgi:hypothetical protein